jgi:hypothetical protein
VLTTHETQKAHRDETISSRSRWFKMNSLAHFVMVFFELKPATFTKQTLPER